MPWSTTSIGKAIEAKVCSILALLVTLSTLISCPTPLGDRDDIVDFIDTGKSIVRIRSATFYDGSAVLSRVPSGKTVTVVLDIINPSDLDVTYTVTSAAPGLLTVTPQAHPAPASTTRLEFSFTAAVGAEQRDLDFTVGKYVAGTNRTFPDETVSITCDTPPEPAEAVDAAYNTANKVFTAFRLPSGATNADLSKVELTYARANGSGASKTVTLSVSSPELTTASSPNILLDSDSRNRYFQPGDVVGGEAYNFWITIIDAAGQRSATADTTKLDPNTTRTPIFTTPGGLFAQAEPTKTVTIRGDTPGSTIYWRTGSGAYKAGTSNPLSLEISQSETVRTYAVKAGLANSAVAEEVFELKCLKPDIEVTGTGTPTATITGRTAGASFRWRYSYETDAAAVTVAPPDASSMATTTTGSPADSGSYVAWATKAGWTDSDRSVSDYATKVATPVFNTAAGIHECSANLSVAVSCPTEGSTVLWRRLNESTYTSLGASSGTITLTESTGLVIKATKPGYVPSDEATGAYTLKCRTPTLSPNFSGVCAADTYPVTLSCATVGATINWSHAGGSGTGTSITLDRSRTVTAYATRTGWDNSDNATGVYSLRCPAPTLTPANYDGVYSGGATFPITLSGGPTGATYYWDLDSGVVSGTGASLSINRSRTVNAICSRTGWVDSVATTGVYAFMPAAPDPITYSTGNTLSNEWARGANPIVLSWPTPVFTFGGTMAYRYKIDGGEWTPLGFVPTANISVAGLDSGSHTVYLAAYDAVEGSYTATNSKDFKVDNTPPDVTLINATGTIGGSNTTVYFETSDVESGVDRIELTIIGSTTYTQATTGGTVGVWINATVSTYDYEATVFDKVENKKTINGFFSVTTP